MSTMTFDSNKFEFDSPWKNILDSYLREFLTLCFPTMGEQIDWHKRYEILDKELLKLTKASQLSNRVADKLFKVWLLSGEEVWLLLHIEIQSKQEKTFALRMMTYHYRIFDRYQKKVVSIALLTDNNTHWRPTRYVSEQWGCRFEMQFITLKLIDYRFRIAELEKSSNPFSMVILSHLAALEKYTDDHAKLKTKIKLTRMLYRHRWNKTRVLDLYRFLDCLLTLPEALALEYHDNHYQIEVETHMQYITTAERIGIQKGIAQGMQEGMEKGIQQGIQKGIQKGIQQGEVRVLIKLLQLKFNSVPESYVQQLESSDQEKLLSWAEKILDANTIEDVFV